MRRRLRITVFLFLLVTFAPAQMTDLSTSGFGSVSRPDASHQTVVVLAGRVVSEAGFALSESVTVILQCSDHPQASSHSDAEGNFNLTVGVRDVASRPGLAPGQGGALSAYSLSDCELYGDLPGYRSERIRLSHNADSGIIQVGAIVLHPISAEDPFPVSVTSLAAPEQAKKALEKGREQEKKGKWAAAAGYFKRAVEVYPRYALAWAELGRTQVQQNSFAEAEESFHQSVQQDSRFVDGYVGLTYLALKQRQWKELADTTERVVEFAPHSAEFWFLNAVANFNLGNIEPAETSISRGLRSDPKHQVPDMEYLYGLILARRHDYSAAAQHVSNYLHLVPDASNAKAARASLTQFAQEAKYSTSASR